jgi:hypothetical protein
LFFQVQNKTLYSLTAEKQAKIRAVLQPNFTENGEKRQEKPA